MDLNALYKKQDHWIGYVTKLSNSEEVAREITQRMYLKLHKVKKDIDDWYVLTTLKNLYFDYLKNENVTISLESCYNIESDSNSFEIDDEQLNILKRFERLDDETKKYIKESDEKSLRDMEEDYNESYMSIYRKILKGREKAINNGGSL